MLVNFLHTLYFFLLLIDNVILSPLSFAEIVKMFIIGFSRCVFTVRLLLLFILVSDYGIFSTHDVRSFVLVTGNGHIRVITLFFLVLAISGTSFPLLAALFPFFFFVFVFYCFQKMELGQLGHWCLLFRAQYLVKLSYYLGSVLLLLN